MHGDEHVGDKFLYLRCQWIFDRKGFFSEYGALCARYEGVFHTHSIADFSGKRKGVAVYGEALRRECPEGLVEAFGDGESFDTENDEALVFPAYLRYEWYDWVTHGIGIFFLIVWAESSCCASYRLFGFFLIDIIDGAFDDGSIRRIGEECAILFQRPDDMLHRSSSERAKEWVFGMKCLDNEFTVPFSSCYPSECDSERAEESFFCLIVGKTECIVPIEEDDESEPGERGGEEGRFGTDDHIDIP